MSTVVAPLLFLPALVLGVAAQAASKVEPRRSVDISLAGLDGVARPSSIGSLARLFCVPRIEDQATGACLQASSTPTLGMLFPYPGENNVFDPLIHSTVGGGRDNTASGSRATVAGGSGNSASGFGATIGGGGANSASSGPATVSGGQGNTASDASATVGGGFNNSATGFAATVGGGAGNLASAYHATVGGGLHNTSSGVRSTVGGGSYCTADASFDTVAGGYANTASGSTATVGGGAFHTASGYSATIPGGFDNRAPGDHSFAAGRSAMANHDGAFVWGDSFFDGTPSLKSSSAPDECNVYCSGGARFFSNSAATTGVFLAPGASAWTQGSDRNAKENVEPVDPRDVLERVCALPLATWNYSSQSDSIRHMGPMAQDFYASFGLGLGDKTIDTVDPDGVALAAIQGLNVLLQQKDAELTELRGRVERLEALMTAFTK